jgi:hypothetical protein
VLWLCPDTLSSMLFFIAILRTARLSLWSRAALQLKNS